MVIPFGSRFGSILRSKHGPSHGAQPTLLSLQRQTWTHADPRPPRAAQDYPEIPPRCPKRFPRASKTSPKDPPQDSPKDQNSAPDRPPPSFSSSSRFFSSSSSPSANSSANIHTLLFLLFLPPLHLSPPLPHLPYTQTLTTTHTPPPPPPPGG